MENPTSTGQFDVRALLANGHAMVRDKSDAGLFVKFYERKIYNAFKTEQAKKEAAEKGIPDDQVEPVFEKEIFCKIRPPGRLEEWDQPVREQDKARFKKEWYNFQHGIDAASGGTNLIELKDLAEDQIQHLEYMGVHSIEQLANATDGVLAQLGMGTRELRDRARAWVLEKDTSRPFDAMKAENADLKKRMADLEKTLAKLSGDKK